MLGMSAPEWSVYMRDELAVDREPEAIDAEVVKRLLEVYRERLPLLPGAVEAVERLAARWPLGLASSSNLEVIEVVMEAGASRRTSRPGSPPRRWGPASRRPTSSSRRRGGWASTPAACAAVEDSHNGILSARAAGMTVLALPNDEFPPGEDALAKAARVLESLDELTVEAVEGPGADPALPFRPSRADIQRMWRAGARDRVRRPPDRGAGGAWGHGRRLPRHAARPRSDGRAQGRRAALLQDDVARRRFLQECRLAASIDHPHVIPIYYAGEEAGVPYLAMRYVAGDDRRGLVRREGPLAPARAARIVAQVAGALDAAHAAGLVHRDVKPANVLLAAGDHAYLSDFGLTRHVRSTSGASAQGSVGRDARLRRARADSRWQGRRASRRLRPGLPPVLPAHRWRAVSARRRRGQAVGSPHRAAPGRSAAAPEAAAFDPRDPPRAREVARRPPPIGRRSRPRPRPPPPACRGRARAHRRARGSGHRREADGHAPRLSRSATPAPPDARARVAGAATVAVAVACRRASHRPGQGPKRAGPPRATPTPPAGAQKPRVVATVRWGSRPNAWRPGTTPGSAPGAPAAWPPLTRTPTGRCAACARAPMAARRTWSATTPNSGSRRGPARSCRLDPERGRPLAAPVPLAMDPSAIAVRGDAVWVGGELDEGPAEIRPHRRPLRGHCGLSACRPAHPGDGVRPPAVCGRSTARRTTSSGAIP